MKTQNAHEHVLVVGQVCHILDILNMGMLAKNRIYSVQNSTYWYIPVHTPTYLGCLARCVIRIAPQHNFSDLVQNAVRLFEIPLALFACLVRQLLLEEV
jgi:hypothetical protein